MRKLLLLSLGWLLSNSYLAAQLANTTALVGNVNDSAGASMAGVTVTATDTGTKEVYKATTNEEGLFTFQFLKPGTYSITASQQGFQTLTKNDVIVNPNETVRADFTLVIGQVTEHIVVSGGVPPIATDEASVKETISSHSVVELPLNGRDPLQLATTAPGVLPGQKASNGVPPGEDFI